MIKKIKSFIFRQYLNAKPNAQYRFLVGKLQSTMDIDLMSAVIEAGFFRKNLVPLPVKVDLLKKIAVFAPHQDDEVIGCGGLLLKLAQLGCEIHLVFITDGRPGGPNWQQKVTIRSEEIKIVASKLNAKTHEIGINNISLIPTTEQWKDLKAIANASFDAIFTPWALDSPPKHRLCNFFIIPGIEI